MHTQQHCRSPTATRSTPIRNRWANADSASRAADSQTQPAHEFALLSLTQADIRLGAAGAAQARRSR